MTGASGGGLRKPLFVMAIIVAVLVIACELALSPTVGGSAAAALTDTGSSLDPETTKALSDPANAALTGDTPPGSGIRYLALVDGLLLFTVLLLGSSVIFSQRVYARVQGIVTFVAALLWIVGSFVLALVAFVKLLLMIGLFVAPPFGTIAYLVVWGWFPVGNAAVVLGLLLFLKLVFVGFLVAAQPRFLRVKGLMILVAVSVILQLVLGLIHGILPRVVVSIGDEFWAVITAIVALLWSVVMLIVAIPAIVNAIRVSGSLAE
jgi:hypothetical protein